ncbi:MAG: camphor resistance protein CrcB [Gammaproteobacteria bacterium RIFCSPHIGHO2_12_FULL_41_20]|nr:MAG: camphor resistance protein CrcB [Gammaproteobacteria bacterium RIFCSPHIGHO2_12_FULL_41_20]
MRGVAVLSNSALIFIGAGIGGVLRYWVAHGVYFILGRQFPYGTFVVNVSGCFLMGLLYVITLERLDGAGAQLRALLLIGLLGGYTTFSSFSIETINLFESGNWLGALMNVLLSTIICIVAAWLGIMGGRSL